MTQSDDLLLPALLRAARATYGSAVRAALTHAEYGDVPRNGPYVLGAIAHSAAPLAQVIKDLGVSKQAAGQLVDTLVVRGYLDRQVDAEDRRRLTVTLTQRGRAAAAAARSAVERIDAELAKRVTPDHIAHTRATLAALIDVGHDTAGQDRDNRSANG